MKVLALRGISGCGKSTYANELKAQGWAVVSRDAIRETVFKDYASVDEDAVTVIEDASIDALLRAGRNVVIDNTNIRLKYLKRFAGLAAKHNATFDVKQFDSDVRQAQERVVVRASRGGRFVPMEVIEKQARSLKSSKLNLDELYVPTFETYARPEDRPLAILVDIDGTLAHNDGHRSFYDYTNVYNDKVKHEIADIVNRFHSTHAVIIMSGRDDSCQDETARWLQDNDINFDEIHMRKTGDQREDSIIKIELFDEYVRYNYAVDFVLDDRQQVVDAWRSIGLTCLQVAPGNF